ncbi:unnamed protein product, partial [Linum tenue]
MKAAQNLKVNRNQNLKAKGGQNLQNTGQSRDSGSKATKKAPAKYVAPGSLGRKVQNRPSAFSTLTSSSDVSSTSLPIPQTTPKSASQRVREP